MIPEGLKYASNVAPEDLAPKVRTSKTWKLDKKKKRVVSEFIDGKEAVKQAVFLHLSIENKSAFIHTNGFGAKMNQFIGMDMDLVIAKLPDVVKDALAWDERIFNVTDFEFEKIDRNKLKVTFLITSCFGEFDMEVVVDV